MKGTGSWSWVVCAVSAFGAACGGEAVGITDTAPGQDATVNVPGLDADADTADAPDAGRQEDTAGLREDVVGPDAPPLGRDGDEGEGETGETDTAEPDGDFACEEAPLPFPMPTSETAWLSLSSEITSNLGPANHRGQDVIVREGAPQILVGKFAYSFLDKDLIDEDVDIWMQREVPCGAWEHLGTFRTSDDGEYGTTYGIEDDGGRVFFEVPADKRFPVGRYPVRMVVGGDLTLASFDLVVVAEGTQAIVTDIDGTLTTGDDQLMTEIAFEIFSGTYVQEAYPDGDRMLSTWADKGYLIVYVTGRPDFLRPMTERWVEPRFPPGPLHLTDTNGQALPTNDGVGTYKLSFLEYLENQDIDIVAAYGNATTDIYAYLAAGLPKDRIFIIGKHAGEEGTMALSGSYTAHLPWVEAFPAATHPAPRAFGWW